MHTLLGTTINQAWNHVVGTLIDGVSACWARVSNSHQHTIHWKHVTSYRSISKGAQYVTLNSKIKCLSLAFGFFGNPTNKTETGTAYIHG